MENIKDIIDKIYNQILLNIDKRIILLRNKQVIQWIFDDLTFLSLYVGTNKNNEDEWGRNLLKVFNPKLKVNKQWTHAIGEQLCRELILLDGFEYSNPCKKDHYKPDVEDNNYIWEVKTQTYYTSGTAGEKILGCPFKYAEVPKLYCKPLKILCIGGAEKICRNSYGNLKGIKNTKIKQKFIDFFKSQCIEFIGATDILKLLITN